MPILERDPWRFQYFEAVQCPEHVDIPTDDPDSWELYPQHRWIYDKLKIARSQGLPCGRHDEPPLHFPVFAKPAINLKGMGAGSLAISNATMFREHVRPGMMWMPLFTGEHVSTDVAVEKGRAVWMKHALGIPYVNGMFTHWNIETAPRPDLQTFLGTWVEAHMAGYTGMMNFETIAGQIIETHLRFADQWCDLYGAGWIEALIGLYEHGHWQFNETSAAGGHSVPLFASHGAVPPHPAAMVQKAVRSMPGIASLQITYHAEGRHVGQAMPPGGFRLAVVNCTDLTAGIAARNLLATAFRDCELFLPDVVNKPSS